MSRRNEIIERALEVKQLPPAVTRALALLSDPSAEIAEVARVVSVDPGLTANILRLANSSLFGGVARTASVRDALVRLGSARVSKLLISLGVAPRVSGAVRGYGLPPGALLTRSVTVALASVELGNALGLSYPEYTFTAGLLADVGKIVLGTFLEVDADPIISLAYDRGLSFEQAERQVLGVDHAEVGAVVLEHWGLPGEIVDVVRHRLAPEDCPRPSTALDLVHYGDVIARMSGLGLGIDGLNYAPSLKAADRLGLTREKLEAALSETVDKAAGLKELLAATEGPAE